MTLCILGRQPKIGLAELEVCFGADAVTPVGNTAALLDGELDLRHFGGTIKTAVPLATVSSTNFDRLVREAQTLLRHLVADMPGGKVKFGISFYGINPPEQRVNIAGLTLKKTIKQLGRSVRVVPNKSPALTSAQVLHNQLLSDVGIELILVRHGETTIIARTTQEQDIEDYARRDHGRPRRDAFVGMLPPKLAQIMINLGIRSADSPLAFGHSSFPEEQSELLANGAGDLKPNGESSGQNKTGDSSKDIAGSKSRDTLETNETSAQASNDATEASSPRILDPFCGTGVLLQEAALRTFTVYGTDIEERMIRYTRDNINWLQEAYNFHVRWYLEVGDATEHQWQQPIDAVICETYLGQPLSGLPKPEKLESIIQTGNTIHRKFLQNISTQIESGTPLCLAVPAWRVGNGFKHLPVLRDLEELGYKRHSLVHADWLDLIYHREDQIVARELLILTKK